MTYRIRLAAECDGQGQLTLAGTAVLLGINVPELFDIVGPTMDANDLPLQLKHLGRQRASEAKAHSESEHAVDVVNYWAVKQWGARIALTHDTTAADLWLTTNDTEVATWLASEANP